MAEEAQPEQKRKPGYRSGLPGPLGVLDLWLARFEAAILGVGVLLMALNTVSNVIARFVFQSSLFFSEELNSILIVLITFAGISYAARWGRHIRMSAIYDTFRPGLRKILMVAISLATSALLFLLSWYALEYLLSVKSSGRLLPALQFPVWWTFIYVPVGLLLTAVQYLLTAIRNMNAPDIYLSTQVVEGYEDDDIGL